MNKGISVIGWFIVLLGLYWWSKTRSGYSVIYYSLVLILLLLVVGNYQAITKVMTVKEGGTTSG